MPDTSHPLKTEFGFGSTKVRIVQGDILKLGVEADALASTDDNYLTMASGWAGRLRERAGPYYVRAAQAQAPAKVGTAVVTKAYRLPDHGLNVKYVLHGVVIDYDSYDLPLEQVVYQATANCLEKAEEAGLASIVFPAFATGSGGLSMEACARHMCSAIKSYLAQECPFKVISIVLYLPEGDQFEPEVLNKHQDLNRRFIREANLVLGLPYDPASSIRQTRDFFGRDEKLREVEGIISGEQDDGGGKRHVVVLGGPGSGKWALLDQLYYRAQGPEGRLSEGRRLVKLTFGRVHENTPASFVYHKFLRALGRGEEDKVIKRELKKAYADPDMDCDRFLDFLKRHPERYTEVVFLVDHLPYLLHMETKEAGGDGDVTDFWRDLDRLQERVRFVYTARDDEQYQQLVEKRLQTLAEGFHRQIVTVRLKCVSDAERQDWVDQLYRRYLDRDAIPAEHEFFAEEAGRHPYLISLAGYALVEALKRDALTNPAHPDQYNHQTLAPFLQQARAAMDEPRRAFFDLLMGRSLPPEDRVDLKSLARAVVREEELRSLEQDVEAGDNDAMARWAQLQAEDDPRQYLHTETLSRLEERGYLVDASSPATAQFMAPSFAAYAADFFGLGRAREGGDQPQDVVISLLSPQPGVIRSMFRGRGAKIVTAQKELLPEIKGEFMGSFGDFVSHQLYPDSFDAPDVFRDFEEIGNHILTQFATGAIKAYLQDPPFGSTILLAVEDALKDIPWELMLEPAYAGEIPFQVGRSMVSLQAPSNVRPPVRAGRDGGIKALLIGDPTDDLIDAREEVEALAERLRRDDRFADPDVLIGSADCKRLRLQTALASGKYALVHYAGHTHYDGYRSAWQLADGKDITTDMLTSALQMAPPALVFSSSCESAEAGEPQPIKYEDQTFDLPSAFLQAGVEAYIGTLWEVDSFEALRFAEAFYDGFLDGGHSLGECLRRAKWGRKRAGDRINWLAYILYGDPHLAPGDLFPGMQG